MYAYTHDSNTMVDPWGLDKKIKVFWSGGRLTQQTAQEYAESIGGTILEMTLQGKALEAWTKDMDRVDAESLWKKTSADFATSTPKSRTHTIAFIDSSRYRRADSVWKKIEKLILDKKGLTTEIRDINSNKLKTGTWP